MPMKSAEKLTAAQKLVSQCDRCGNCLTVCPLFGSKDIESSAARGKNSILPAAGWNRRKTSKRRLTSACFASAASQTARRKSKPTKR